MSLQSLDLSGAVETEDPIGQARQYFAVGDHGNAARCCRLSLQHERNVAEALTLLGSIATLNDAIDDAIVLLRLAASIAPKDVKALTALAVAFRARKQFADARKQLVTALGVEPGKPEILWNLAHVLHDQKDWAECERVFSAIFQRGLARPKDYHPRAWALFHLKRFDRAERAFERVVVLDPADDDGWYGLAYVRYERQVSAQNRPRNAVATYRRVTRANPRHILAYVNLAAIFLNHSNIDGALAISREGMAVDAEDANLYVNYALALVAAGKPREAIAAIRRALAKEPGHFKWRSNELFYLHYVDDVDERQLLDAHRQWDFSFGRQMASYRRPFAAARAVPDKRLRIGYVSPDLRRHSCASFLVPLFTGRDRDGFELYCYSKTQRPDSTTELFRAQSDVWRDINDQSPIDVAAQIRQDEVDILVDLTGHTARHSLVAFAQKPAPVQVTWLGYPGTTGLDTMDYRLSDHGLTPLDTPELFSEEIYRLDRLSHCYTPEPDAPAVAPLPALRNGYVTFGSFNNFAKLSDATVALWAGVLAAVPTARICLKSRYIGSPEARNHILSRFRARGADVERIQFIGGQEAKNDHLSAYGQIDVGIDTFPYGGMTTSCEALWMGVPVLTLTGKRTSARYGTALAHGIGLPQFAVPTPAAFAETAAALASDIDGLARLRAGLRDRVAASELCDGPGFARAVEAAYRDMWRRWCAQRTD